MTDGGSLGWATGSGIGVVSETSLTLGTRNELKLESREKMQIWRRFLGIGKKLYTVVNVEFT
jgi:hypothetical protein